MPDRPSCPSVEYCKRVTDLVEELLAGGVAGSADGGGSEDRSGAPSLGRSGGSSEQTSHRHYNVPTVHRDGVQQKKEETSAHAQPSARRNAKNRKFENCRPKEEYDVIRRLIPGSVKNSGNRKTGSVNERHLPAEDTHSEQWVPPAAAELKEVSKKLTKRNPSSGSVSSYDSLLSRTPPRLMHRALALVLEGQLRHDTLLTDCLNRLSETDNCRYTPANYPRQPDNPTPLTPTCYQSFPPLKTLATSRGHSKSSTSHNNEIEPLCPSPGNEDGNAGNHRAPPEKSSYRTLANSNLELPSLVAPLLSPAARRGRKPCLENVCAYSPHLDGDFSSSILEGRQTVKNEHSDSSCDRPLDTSLGSERLSSCQDVHDRISHKDHSWVVRSDSKKGSWDGSNKPSSSLSSASNRQKVPSIPITSPLSPIATFAPAKTTPRLETLPPPQPPPPPPKSSLAASRLASNKVTDNTLNRLGELIGSPSNIGHVQTSLVKEGNLFSNRVESSIKDKVQSIAEETSQERNEFVDHGRPQYDSHGTDIAKKNALADLPKTYEPLRVAIQRTPPYNRCEPHTALAAGREGSMHLSPHPVADHVEEGRGTPQHYPKMDRKSTSSMENKGFRLETVLLSSRPSSLRLPTSTTSTSQDDLVPAVGPKSGNNHSGNNHTIYGHRYSRCSGRATAGHSSDESYKFFSMINPVVASNEGVNETKQDTPVFSALVDASPLSVPSGLQTPQTTTASPPASTSVLSITEGDDAVSSDTQEMTGVDLSSLTVSSLVFPYDSGASLPTFNENSVLSLPPSVVLPMPDRPRKPLLLPGLISGRSLMGESSIALNSEVEEGTNENDSASSAEYKDELMNDQEYLCELQYSHTQACAIGAAPREDHSTVHGEHCKDNRFSLVTHSSPKEPRLHVSLPHRPNRPIVRASSPWSSQSQMPFILLAPRKPRSPKDIFRVQLAMALPELPRWAPSPSNAVNLFTPLLPLETHAEDDSSAKWSTQMFREGHWNLKVRERFRLLEQSSMTEEQTPDRTCRRLPPPPIHSGARGIADDTASLPADRRRRTSNHVLAPRSTGKGRPMEGKSSQSVLSSLSPPNEGKSSHTEVLRVNGVPVATLRIVTDA